MSVSCGRRVAQFTKKVSENRVVIPEDITRLHVLSLVFYIPLPIALGYLTLW